VIEIDAFKNCYYNSINFAESALKHLRVPRS